MSFPAQNCSGFLRNSGKNFPGKHICSVMDAVSVYAPVELINIYATRRSVCPPLFYETHLRVKLARFDNNLLFEDLLSHFCLYFDLRWASICSSAKQTTGVGVKGHQSVFVTVVSCDARWNECVKRVTFIQQRRLNLFMVGWSRQENLKRFWLDSFALMFEILYFKYDKLWTGLSNGPIQPEGPTRQVKKLSRY